MDGDGSDFSFSTEYTKGQDATDVSWADIFLDGIPSDDQNTSETGGISAYTSNLGAGIHGNTQQMHHQAQTSMMGGQLQFHIPTPVANNAVQQAGTKLCGTVAYIAPSSTHQHVNTAGGIQNMMSVANHPQVASVNQQQNSAKLVQITPSFPMAQLQNSVPLQTFLQPSQTINGQTIYGNQGSGLFPAQGSVHIENPKVVNVNFGPHVIGSDGSGHQTIFQTAEGKRVLITNSQLQHMPQSISLTQPLVGTQLINAAGSNVIRASLAGTHTIMPSNATQSRQIVLPSGQTVIPQQTNAAHGGITKNVVIRPLNQNMSPVIYQSGQGGHMIHSQPTLITSSGSGLQVVNAGGGQGNQVQLIAQPSINQAGMGQQQGTVMNLINNSSVISGTGNQITGFVPGQNIIVNGQVLSFGQLGGLTVPQLHVQRNSQGGVTLADLNAAVINNSSHFQPTTQQLIIQQNGQQQQIVLQPKNNSSPSLVTHAVPSHRLISNLQGTKNTRTPTPNASSASSTPVLTPTPSTPTPTPTPELISDFGGSKSNQGINLLKQALDMSDIDLQSFEDDINFLDDSSDCFSLMATQPSSQTSASPSVNAVKKQLKSGSKSSKPKLKNDQPLVNVRVNNNVVPFQKTSQFHNTQEQSITISPQQKIINASGQVYVLSANGQQFILQSSTNSTSAIAPHLKPITSLAPTAGSLNQPQLNTPSNYNVTIKGITQQKNTFNSNLNEQMKLESPFSLEQKNVFVTNKADADQNFFIKASTSETGIVKSEISDPLVSTAYTVFSTASSFSNSPVSISQPFAGQQTQHSTNQQVLTIGGRIIKQEPLTPVIKQDMVTDFSPSVSHTATFVSVPQSSTPASIFSYVTTPLVTSSASFTTVVTTTTQSHQSTIMSTSQALSSQQLSLSTSGTYMSHSSACDMPSISANNIYHSQSISPTLSHSANYTSAFNISATRKLNSKEKDPATVKAMIPIKIADSTLMLSLTPEQKEKLEHQLSRMSKKDQEEFLIHQQNVIRCAQQVQQKQIEQLLKQQQKLQLEPAQEFQQQQLDEKQQFQQSESQQLIHQPSHLTVSHQLSQLQTYSSTEQMGSSAHTSSRSDLMSHQAEQVTSGLPTTVQELIEKPEENFQHSALKPSEHHLRSTPPHQWNDMPILHHQQMYSNLHLGTSSLSSNNGSVQQFVMPQIGGRCLAEQQLVRDRSLAVESDVSSPFKSKSDAMRRLVRYHTLQDHKPDEGSKIMRVWDTRYSKLCDYLVKKKRCYLRRFNKMKLYQDMCQEKQPEHIQNLICFNEQLQELINREKEVARSQPGHFDAVRTEPLAFSNSWTTTSTNPGNEKEVYLTSGSVKESSLHVFKNNLARRNSPPTDQDSGSEKSVDVSPSSRKRLMSDRGSSGMLKLVFKRGTTDNFSVENSSENVNMLPPDLRPVVDLEKSDSEYEFDSSAANVTCNQSIKVRRRSSSAVSHQTSFNVGSYSSSVSSQSEEICDHLSEEEDLAEERDDSSDEKEEGDYEDLGKISCDDDDEFIADKRRSKNMYHVSFEDAVENNDLGSDCDSSCSVEDTDALMETNEVMSKSAAYHYKTVTTDTSSQSFLCADKNSSNVQKHNNRSKSTDHFFHKLSSVTSRNAFSSNFTYSGSGSVSGNDWGSDHNTHFIDKNKSIDHRKFTFQASPHDAPGSHSQSSQETLPMEEEEYVAESPVRNLQEAARKGLPSSSLFTTPNKNLLETDAMFNSEDDDDDDKVRGSHRVVSRFEIDKDPQSSMIDDSVRSVINSVLNDDDDKDAHNNWVTSSHRPPSLGQRNLFQPSSSILLSTSHDNDLDVAVQSILNS